MTSPSFTAPNARMHSPGAVGVLASWAWLARACSFLLLIALSPSSHTRRTRAATAQSICAAAWQTLPGYVLLTTLVCVVVTRIVIVTAESYGLSQYALEAVVRVFVLELIPLSAALFVALRAGVAAMKGITAQSPVQVVPPMVGNAFAVVMLATVNGLVALAVAYVVLHGLSPWALPSFGRLVGQVFNPVIALGLALKTLLFSLAVAIVPVAVALEPRQDASRLPPAELRLMSRLLTLLVLIEAFALGIKHF